MIGTEIDHGFRILNKKESGKLLCGKPLRHGWERAITINGDKFWLLHTNYWGKKVLAIHPRSVSCHDTDTLKLKFCTITIV